MNHKMDLKKEILTILENNRDKAISGQALGQRLGVSRAAAWKAVQALRSEGHQIIAATNRGYQLAQNSDLLTEEGIRRHLQKPFCQMPVYVFKQLDSTNEEAKRIALQEDASSCAVFSESQTKGKGRYGKSFFSPAQTGLYMSLLLRPQGDMHSLLSLTFAAAVAVCRAIEELTDCRPKIKWVNDVYLEQKKICGILTEAVSDFESARAQWVIIGIGVNVKTPLQSFPEELQETAGSLDRPDLSRSRLAAQILNELLDLCRELGFLAPSARALSSSGDPARAKEALLNEYRKRSLVLGKTISYTKAGTLCQALALDINQEGNLLVRDEKGGLSLLKSGEISIVKDSLWNQP